MAETYGSPAIQHQFDMVSLQIISIVNPIKLILLETIIKADNYYKHIYLYI